MFQAFNLFIKNSNDFNKVVLYIVDSQECQGIFLKLTRQSRPFKGSSNIASYVIGSVVAAELLKTNIAVGQYLFLSHVCLYFFYICVQLTEYNGSTKLVLICSVKFVFHIEGCQGILLYQQVQDSWIVVLILMYYVVSVHQNSD
jgi:hypothetical protein